jgi:N-methylhydantoinase A
MISVDTGGTFTDVVRWDGATFVTHKLLSTPRDPSVAIADGVKTIAPAGASCVIHGTTVATNALLERRLAVTAFITNHGFRDVLRIARQNRPELYTLRVERPPALIAPELCFEVAGRLGPKGQEEAPLDPAQFPELARALRDAGVESVAVCLLHSYANSSHEETLAQGVDAALAALGHRVDWSLSSRVFPQFREVERGITTAVNAALRPRVSAYLERLQQALEPTPVRIVLSNGGAVSSGRAADLPVNTVLSGPAGGVLGALRAARLSGFGRIIAFDMGGTSTDVALCDGRAQVVRGLTVAGLPLQVASLGIHTVGAGGGSLAYVDQGGALRVGPTSAGAVPGPACYGRGGNEPTVTDANLLRGHLDPAHFLGGSLRLDPDAAHDALARLGARLGQEAQSLARGICRIAGASMERAVKTISVAKGHDPREYTLVAFGGAGGMHACELAQALRIPRVLLPQHPGLLSAVGMLEAPVRFDLSRTVLLRLGRRTTRAALLKTFAELSAQAVRLLDQEGVPALQQELSWSCDVRYLGQSFELEVPYGLQAAEQFHRAHEAEFGFSLLGHPVEVVNAKVVAEGRAAKLPSETHPVEPHRAEPSGEVLWPSTGPVPLFLRDTLSAGATIAGPALVAEYSATTAVLAGWSCRVDGALNLVLEPCGGGQGTDMHRGSGP